MGQAREVMDRLTEAMIRKDLDAVREVYAPDAVGESPDAGTLQGAEAIAGYLAGFTEAFPDFTYELSHGHECGETAIDEGHWIGTNTGPLPMPDGATVPATGRGVRVRSCDVMTVRDGRAVSHRFYYDQMELLEQLGLAQEA